VAERGSAEDRSIQRRLYALTGPHGIGSGQTEKERTIIPHPSTCAQFQPTLTIRCACGFVLASCTKTRSRHSGRGGLGLARAAVGARKVNLAGLPRKNALPGAAKGDGAIQRTGGRRRFCLVPVCPGSPERWHLGCRHGCCKFKALLFIGIPAMARTWALPVARTFHYGTQASRECLRVSRDN
jgi:hypothetical protein